jgi:hypothetical protein
MPSLVKSAGMRRTFDRNAAAMHSLPELLMQLIVALRMTLMTNATFPDRMRLWSSRRVTSFTQNNLFSIVVAVRLASRALRLAWV